MVSQTLFAASAGERVVGRSLDRVSCSLRSNECLCKFRYVIGGYEAMTFFYFSDSLLKENAASL
jgi:hypothetical protein